jgi:putative ABC transport system permease protein
MIKNYLKSSLAALWQRKWFSLLTLFSIAISLVVVTCGASIWNMINAPFAPEIHKDRAFFLNSSVTDKATGEKVNIYAAKKIFPDNFFYEMMYQIATPGIATLHSTFRAYREFYKDGRKRLFYKSTTDKNFFTVFGFDFVKGKPYTDKDQDAGVNWCVISKELADFYFNSEDCIGEVISSNNQDFHVSGVFKKSAAISLIKPDFLILVNPQKAYFSEINEVTFLCSKPEDKATLDRELKVLANKINGQHPELQVDLFTESSVTMMLNDWFTTKEQYPLYIALVLIILILPILCLIDVLRNSLDNRIEELGIRKAFGASRKIIRIQLLFENIIITVLGGMIGLVFSFFFFLALSSADASNLIWVFFDWRAFFYYLFIFLLIGTLAGIILLIKSHRFQ